MTKRLSLSQLKKYDVNQKVLKALADAQSRAIVFSIIKEGKTAAELAEKHKIPLSSVYKKISELEFLEKFTSNSTMTEKDALRLGAQVNRSLAKRLSRKA